MPPGSGSPPRRIGSAPRAKASTQAAQTAVGALGSDGDVPALVEQLSANFVEQVHRSLGVALDGSTTSLAFVDHYLRTLAQEERSEILSLVAASAGAYYGELVRRRIGATWIGDGQDPRRLRLLLTPQFIHFSPVDQALEAIAGTAISDDDERVSGTVQFDAAFGLRPVPEHSDGEDDASWLQQRLSELSPVPEEEFYSLTCRYETLQLMLELLAARHASQGRKPHQYTISEYLEVLQRLAH